MPHRVLLLHHRHASALWPSLHTYSAAPPQSSHTPSHPHPHSHITHHPFTLGTCHTRQMAAKAECTAHATQHTLSPTTMLRIQLKPPLPHPATATAATACNKSTHTCPAVAPLLLQPLLQPQHLCYSCPPHLGSTTQGCRPHMPATAAAGAEHCCCRCCPCCCRAVSQGQLLLPLSPLLLLLLLSHSS